MKENFFEQYLTGKKGLYACIAILFLIAFIVFKDFILFRNVFLYKDVASDSINASYTHLLNISEYIRTQGFPKWSFNNGIGQNVYSLILRDPTDIFAFWLQKENIAYAVIIKELFKIILSGVVFFLFLQKLSFTRYTAIVGAMLYAFTGFMILGSGWYVFTFEALMLASLLLAFEKIYQDNSWYLFPVVVMLLITAMPFNLYVYGLFLIVYMLFRYIYDNGTQWKGLIILASKMALLTVLGLGMGAVFLFSNLKQMLESARVSGEAMYFDTLANTTVLSLADSQNYMTTILRFFSSDILGTGLNFRGWYNYLEAPLFYCGLLTLLLIPQVFVSISKKQKIMYGVFLGVWLLPAIFPYFRYAFWLFTGDYYRAFSLCVDVCFLFVGLNALHHIDRAGKVNNIILGVTTVILLILLYYPYTDQADVINKDIQSNARNFIVLYAGLIFLFGYLKSKIWVKAALLFLVFVELTYFSYTTVNKKRTPITAKELKQKVGFNDYSVDALAYIEKIDKNFYRLDKTYSSSLAYNGGLNDPQAQFYKGTGSYNSFNQKYYVKFVNGLNITNPGKDKDAALESKRITGLVNRPLLESLCSVKYILTKQQDNRFMYLSHDSLTQFGDVKVFRKKNTLPMGFTYDKYMLADDFAKMGDTQKDIMLFRGVVIDENEKEMYKGFTPISLNDTTKEYSWDLYKADVNALKQDTLAMESYNHNNFKGTITVDKRKLLFFSIPYDTGWKITVDGAEVPVQIVDFGMMGIFIDNGSHQVELNYTVPYLKTGAMVSSVSLLLFISLFFIKRKRIVVNE